MNASFSSAAASLQSKVALFHFLSTYKTRPLNDGLREELWAGISRLVTDAETLEKVLTIGQTVFAACIEVRALRAQPPKCVTNRYPFSPKTKISFWVEYQRYLPP